MPKPWPVDKYPQPPEGAFPLPQPPVTVPAAAVASTLETLNLLDEFLRRYASAATRTELQAFAALHGWDPVQGAQTIIDSIGLDALSLGRAQNATTTNQD